MRLHARPLAVVMLTLLVTACTRRGGGPHLQLVTPSAATPDFGDAPSRSSESLRQGGPGGGGGGGGTAQAQPAGNGGARGNAIGPIIGGAIGVGAAAAAVGAGAIKCEPGNDSPSTTGSSVNVCSGERTPGPPPP
jgi:hypothetical protein